MAGSERGEEDFISKGLRIGKYRAPEGVELLADKACHRYGLGRQSEFKIAKESYFEKSGDVEQEANIFSIRGATAVSPVKLSASLSASVMDASVRRSVTSGISVGARVSAFEVGGSTTLGIAGLRSEAGAHAAGIEVGIPITPLMARGELLGASAETGISFNYIGASMGAHVAKFSAGPLDIRYGFKVGAGMRNGVPEVDMGPVSCKVM